MLQEMPKAQPNPLSVNKYDELIVVVPRIALSGMLSQAHFVPSNSFESLERIVQENKLYIKRKDAEEDPTYKQIIPYFVFRHQNRYFMMQRAANAGEARLKNKFSLGIGGHLRETDIQSLPLDQWGMREFHEEINYTDAFSLSPLGIINDERNEVGKVHLGIVFLVEGVTDGISVRSELKSGALMTLQEIQAHYENLESWSQLVVEHLIKKTLIQGASRMTAATQTIVSTLEARALGLRIDSARATTASKSGHPTSCMSAADMIAALFFHGMQFDISHPDKVSNDRFIMSKGHAIPVVYAAYKQLGVISDQELLSLRAIDSVLEGHPTPRFAYNEAATGSLGQGLSIGAGFALQARIDGLSYKTFVMLGDGELAEGSVWEAADFAGCNKLNNLIALIDCNSLGQSGLAVNEHDVEKIARKFKAFGWHTIVIDGHNMASIVDALAEAKNSSLIPTVIVAKTHKGYGIAQIENKLGFHGKPFTEQELVETIAQLKATFASAAAQYVLLSEEILLVPMMRSKQEKQLLAASLQNDLAAELFTRGKMMAPRKAYGYALAALGFYKEVVALDADVKNSTFTEFFEKQYPSRFVQCFIAEQNMISIATGLTSRGKITFSSTFGAFFTRAHDQIRMASIGRVPLRLCGSHCGVSIGEDGPSQMALEDIAFMRCMPHSVVLYPSDAVSTYALTKAMANYHDGISYLRTTREALPVLYDKAEHFSIGGCKVLQQSARDQVCLVAAGITLHESLKAAQELKGQNIDVAIIDAYSVKPLDVATIRAVATQASKKILVIEDHFAEGGLGEAVKSALASDGFKIDHLAVKDLSRSGKSHELMSLAGIDAAHIAQAVRHMIDAA